MVKNNRIKIFIRFLKENELYSKYMHYLSNEKYCWHRKKTLTISQLNVMYGINDLVNRAFSWDDTYEGYEYWEDFSKKWNKVVSSNKL